MNKSCFTRFFGVFVLCCMVAILGCGRSDKEQKTKTQAKIPPKAQKEPKPQGESVCPPEIEAAAKSRIMNNPHTEKMASYGAPCTYDDISVIKWAVGNPSEAIIQQYNPRKVYCVTAKYRETEEGKTRNGIDSLMIIVNQSGALSAIGDWTSADRPGYERCVKEYYKLRVSHEECMAILTAEIDRNVARWGHMWNTTCPYERPHK